MAREKLASEKLTRENLASEKLVSEKLTREKLACEKLFERSVCIRKQSRSFLLYYYITLTYVRERGEQDFCDGDRIILFILHSI